MKQILILFTITFFLISCKKNEQGGNATINGLAKHHSKVIPYASVFVKYNTKEFPGSDTTQYDFKVRADKDGKFTLNFYKGEYYVYGHGYDYSIPSPYTVVGGVPVKLRSKETVDILLPLTEGD